VAAAQGAPVRRGLWRRIKEVALTDVGVLVRGLDHDSLERIERVLVEADFGPAALELAEELEQELRRGKLKTETAVRSWLADRIGEYLPGSVSDAPLDLGDGAGPGVVLVLGVNGVGKTTFIAKLAHRLRQDGKSVLLAAADTYRAGASEQLKVWAERLDLPCVVGTRGGDPAAVAFDALESATARGMDAVVIDTAGRLHTHGDLMDELKKVVRVLARKRVGAPHESLLVLDATVGQNALQQGRTFVDAVPVTGLVVTKLDGTAKGGAVIRMRRELDLPIRFVGVGETVDDLEVFDPQRFIERLLAD